MNATENKVFALALFLALVGVIGYNTLGIPASNLFQASLMDVQPSSDSKQQSLVTNDEKATQTTDKTIVCINPLNGDTITQYTETSVSCGDLYLDLETKTKDVILRNNSQHALEFNTTFHKVYPDVNYSEIASMNTGWEAISEVAVENILYPVLFQHPPSSTYGKIGLVPGSGWQTGISTDVSGTQTQIQEIITLIEEENKSKIQKKIVENLNKSLESKYWVNKSTLRGDGESFFETLNKALSQIQKSDLSQQTITDAESGILSVNKMLAQKSLELSLEILRINGCAEEIPPAVCEKARNAMDDAIESFEKASRSSSKSISLYQEVVSLFDKIRRKLQE